MNLYGNLRQRLSVKLLLTVALAALVVVALMTSVYFAYQHYSTLVAENRQLKETLVEDPDLEIVSQDTLDPIDSGSLEVSEVEEHGDSPSQAAVAPAKASATQPRNEDDGSSVATEEEDLDRNPPASTFSVSYKTQTLFPETVESYAYGGFEIGLAITANDGDILIPKSTTDSASGKIGFSYSVHGSEYSGSQDSKISCSVMQDGYCKIKDGRTSTVEVTVWLTPDKSGNYAVRFDDITYFEGGEWKTYSLGEKTATIYIPY